jgi:hypothetical protein
MTTKRTVPQAVSDTPEALQAARRGHQQACRDLERTPRHRLDPGNPNHPDYDLKLFGHDAAALLAKQYRWPFQVTRWPGTGSPGGKTNMAVNRDRPGRPFPNCQPGDLR